MSIKIDQALIQGFIDEAFGLDIAHENVHFEPTAGAPWVEIKVIRNEAVPDTLGATVGEDETTGIFQATLYYPENEYSIDAKTKADEIMAAFKIGTVFTYGTQEVLIRRKDRGSGFNEDGWYKLVMRFTFNARTVRTAA